jgi:glycosyltransferase involved in cell wall biosynthesis
MLMRGAYSACDMLVHAGDVETFGLGVAEAMSCERPVIVVAGGALPEVVGRDGSCGVVVSSQDARAMSEAIRRLAASERERAMLGERARERVRVHFSLASMQAEYARAVARAIPSDSLRALP